MVWEICPPPSLSTFDLEIAFNPIVLSFISADYGDPILGNQLDLTGLGTIFETKSEVGSVNVFELSQDLPEDLELFQIGDFTFVTLNFIAIGLGNSFLNLSHSSVPILGDAYGLPLAVEEVKTASIKVVPEPLTFLGSGMAIAWGAWFKKKCGNHKSALKSQN